MESIEELLKKLTINNLDIGGKHWVDVTHVNNPHSFYVRPTMYRTYMGALQAFGDRLLSSEVQMRQIVAYKSKLLRMYVRGQVFFVHNNNEKISCDLYALDYGCFEKNVSLKRIRNIQAIDVPPLAVHCQLADCKPPGDTWSVDSIDCMKHFLGTGKIQMFVRGKTAEVLIVELFNSQPDISTMLALIGCTTLGYGENVINRFESIPPKKHYFKFKQFEIGEQLYIRCQSGETLKSFYVALPADYRTYLDEIPDFTESSRYKKFMRNEDVKVGLPVGVQLDTYLKYERAFVKEITVPDIKVRVQLVDWGKIIEVPYTKLKPISDFFLTNPAIAIFCTTLDSQAGDYRLQKCLYPGYEFKITVVEVGDKFDSPYVVTIEL